MKYIQKMQEVLREGKKAFEKGIKKETDTVHAEFKKLTDQETRMEYLQNMKQPKQKGSTTNRLSLLLQNTSLIQMQFLKEDQMPTED